MRVLTSLALAAIQSVFVSAHIHPPHTFSPNLSEEVKKEKIQQIKDKIAAEGELNPQEHWFDAYIDNITNKGAGSPTYKMRYLVDDTFVDPDSSETPILFYSGNEGDVWTFFDNSGFITTTLAEQLGALVVFGEHRYFGESQPFGDQSYHRDNLKYLTVEQAMMDYVELLFWLRETRGM